MIKTPKEWREEEGLTQEELAEDLKLSYGYISHLETGVRKPSWSVIQKYKKRSGGIVTAESFENTQ